ncbi:hypothetical protein A3A54_00200 [Candidatus Curtissbacteria bacterium RIFCSPLOWO2_01_FULL_39_62]|uniref:Aspartate/glutamate/uridylate kinase domain-containing protein n=2 Tax=Candidatus Curtissiibacteriota TaxID=1752717 RepID=A0A1F5GAQ5_9BACT|nr:MAG: hypothetical protein A2775_00880 [Candidatus Curtissbacteria bacterium RIFCSPHIGHO2_01_FULL_39_57]OGD88938.1 MAG: hypothetical protein A3D04_01950 [Candidatus Curtissbacteria bacterium RIFCSPHIGHO2_02_FULL_40_16b]OGD90688.1 MAG: hypothetical protein A3E11_00945 [Candidatus Curtissbacteria bacterium RIFCSPHIGHO2_12_FULL_38_37]OGE00723.1 MAG: hypothetical protein A3J17_04185 [Candidatus Curtissbacteria bacterium RIFCSPLOWO2_02_FULL_40_11]OGE02437.1 MAG: hypothetical protein A3A54_00200 [C
MQFGGSERQPSSERKLFVTQRLVVKIGSNVITEGATKEKPLNAEFIDNVARQCSELFKSSVEVVIVSSGAVASGRNLLHIEEHDIRDKQVEAVFGQPTLIGTWVEAFKKFGVVAGQALITENDLEEGKNVLRKSLKHGVVIVNWNDAVNSDEMRAFMRLADNDHGAAEVAEAIDADTLLLVTDVEGVIDAKGQLIEDGSQINDDDIFFEGSDKGTGGMVTKVKVLKDLAQKGIQGIITGTKQQDFILKVAKGNTGGRTSFQSNRN